MVEPISTALAGIALVKKSVDFVKQQIQTCNDIGDIIGHIDKAMMGEQQTIKARDKANVDVFAVDNIAKEVIDAKLAREQISASGQALGSIYYRREKNVLMQRNKL